MSVQEHQSFSGSNEGSPSLLEPVAKKICRERNSTETSAFENNNSNNEPTILDVLYEECWREVFQYVHLQDLISTECVSKQWRTMVHRYLQGIRVSLRHNEYVNWWFEHPMRSRIAYIHDYDLDDLVPKFGRSVVGAFCTYFGHIDLIADYCPDLEDLKIIRPDYDYDIYEDNRAAELTKLKRVSFQCAIHFSDEDIKNFITSPVLEELVINFNRTITGRCLKLLRSQLKSLLLDGCKKLNVGNLVSSRALHGLVKLGLNRNRTVTLRNAYRLIERTPELECLTLEAYEYPTEVGGLVNAICRLRRLTHLSFLENINVYDDWLEHIGRCCKALRYVSVGKCKNVTAAGVLALCREGNTLIRLDVSFNDYITDDDVASIIRACPKLKRLDVPFGRRLTPALGGTVAATLAAAAPRPRLRLRLTCTHEFTGRPMENTADLTLDWSENDDPTAWDHHYLETVPNSRPNVSNFEMFYQQYWSKLYFDSKYRTYSFET